MPNKDSRNFSRVFLFFRILNIIILHFKGGFRANSSLTYFLPYLFNFAL